MFLRVFETARYKRPIDLKVEVDCGPFLSIYPSVVVYRHVTVNLK